MKIEIPVSLLSEKQKAQIVSRGEQIPKEILTFEMTPKYAAMFAQMDGAYSKDNFRVDSEKIFLKNVYITSTYGYTNGNWHQVIENIYPVSIICDRYASGKLSIGNSIDEIMVEMENVYQRIAEIQKDNKTFEAERKVKEEEERPAKEAKAKAEQEENAKKAEAQRQADLQRQIEKAVQHKKMIDWAQEHGSERLKKGLEQGHRCEKLYAIEYGAWLINDSDYELDYTSDVEEKDRSCPSLAALEEVDRMKKIDGIEKAKVVWLPNGLQELHKSPEGYIEEQEDGCEAVRVDVQNVSGMWYKTF